jgi:hypothetical protein
LSPPIIQIDCAVRCTGGAQTGSSVVQTSAVVVQRGAAWCSSNRPTRREWPQIWVRTRRNVSTRAGWRVVGSGIGRWLVLMRRDTRMTPIYGRQEIGERTCQRRLCSHFSTQPPTVKLIEPPAVRSRIIKINMDTSRAIPDQESDPVTVGTISGGMLGGG